MLCAACVQQHDVLQLLVQCSCLPWLCDTSWVGWGGSSKLHAYFCSLSWVDKKQHFMPICILQLPLYMYLYVITYMWKCRAFLDLCDWFADNARPALMHVQIVVSAPSGAVLGHVRTSGRAYSSSGWLDVFDADNRLVYSVQGKQCQRLWLAGPCLHLQYAKLKLRCSLFNCSSVWHCKLACLKMIAMSDCIHARCCVSSESCKTIQRHNWVVECWPCPDQLPTALRISRAADTARYRLLCCCLSR